MKDFAKQYEVEPERMLQTLKATCFRQKAKDGKEVKEITNEHLLMLVMIAKQYKLNPFLRELYAFPSDNGIVPIVGVDGWAKIINNNPEFDGMEFVYGPELPPPMDEQDRVIGPAAVEWIECKIFRKDRSKPTVVREYLRECRRPSNPWRDMPIRMLRHKAMMQAGRVALGLSGIHDEEEGEVITVDAAPSQPVPSQEIKTGRIQGGSDSRTDFTKAMEAMAKKKMEQPEAPPKYTLDASPQAEAAPPVTDCMPEPKKSDGEIPAWVNTIINEIDNSPRPSTTESIGNRLVSEFRSPETPAPDKIQWYPVLLEHWATKMGASCLPADRPRMQAKIDNWMQYLGAVGAKVKAGFGGGK